MASRSALAKANEAGFQCCNREFNLKIKETTMAWTKPEFTDLRFGFEVTMYIANR
jgi:coenzyme PQQ precursor peptide PqqA